MIDFEIFDKASRGAWGSFLLLFRTKGKSLAALGAVLTLLLLATDTFFQQVSDLYERWILEGHGDIPRVIQYIGNPEVTYRDGWLLESDEVNLRRMTLQYFYDNGSQPVAFGNGTRPDIPLYVRRAGANGTRMRLWVYAVRVRMLLIFWNMLA